MENIMQLIHHMLDVKGIIEWGGLVIIGVIIFVETGLFFGFFLPGDSLLITAGIFAAARVLNLGSLLLLAAVCAVVGDQVGYFIGNKMGKLLFSKKDSRFFKQVYLKRTQAFYAKHGSKTIVLARFVPIVRTFAPAVAGAAGMPYQKFVFFNIAGGIGWVFSTVLLGFFVGKTIPNIEKYLHLVIGIVIVLSFIPLIIEIRKQKKEEAHLNSVL